MFRGRIRTFVACIVAVASACDDSSTSAPPTTIQPATQPWMVKPKGAEEFLASTRSATTVATTTATTRSATSARRDEMLSRPDTAIAYMFELIKGDRFAELREVMVESSTPSQLRAEFHNSIEGFKRGATVSPIEYHERENAALVIVRSTGADPKDQDLGHFVLIQTFGKWKVLPAEPNARRLGPEEKRNVIEVMKWGLERMRQLRGAQGQPTTALTPTPSNPAAPQ